VRKGRKKHKGYVADHLCGPTAAASKTRQYNRRVPWGQGGQEFNNRLPFALRARPGLRFHPKPHVKGGHDFSSISMRNPRVGYLPKVHTGP